MRNKIQYIVLAFILAMAAAAPLARALTIDDITGSSGSAGGSTGGGLSMPAGSGDLSGNPSGGEFSYPSGTLLNDNGTIYLIRGTQKIAFANSAAFTGLGYSFANVVSGDSNSYALNAYIINSAKIEHPWGSWLSYKGTIYYLTSQGMAGVPSGDIFLANSGNWNMVLPANAYDLKVSRSLPVLAANDSRVYSAPAPGFNNPTTSNPVTYNFSGSTANQPANTSTGQPLAVTAPAYGTQFAPNSRYSVTWEGGGSADLIDLALVYQGSCNSGTTGTSTCGSVYNIVTGAQNAGSYFWLVPSQLAAYQGGYQIKLTDESLPQSPVFSAVFFIGNSGAGSTASTSVPTVLLNSVLGPLAVGTQIIGKISVIAPSSTSVTLTDFPVSVSVAGGAAVNTISLIDDVTSQTVSTYTPPFNLPVSTTATTTIAVNNDNVVAAGAVKTYDVAVSVTGTLGTAGSSSVALTINGYLNFTISYIPFAVPNPTNQVTVSN